MDFLAATSPPSFGSTDLIYDNGKHKEQLELSSDHLTELRQFLMVFHLMHYRITYLIIE